MTDTEINLTLYAICNNIGGELHKNQKRGGEHSYPYYIHPVEVSTLLIQCGIFDTDALCCGLLHDTLEDTMTHIHQSERHHELFKLLREQCPSFVSDKRIDGIINLVLQCTDKKEESKQDRKRNQVKKLHNMSLSAIHVKMADKWSNVKDMANELYYLNKYFKSEGLVLGYALWSYEIISTARELYPDTNLRLYDKVMEQIVRVVKYYQEKNQNILKEYFQNDPVFKDNKLVIPRIELAQMCEHFYTKYC